MATFLRAVAMSQYSFHSLPSGYITVDDDETNASTMIQLDERAIHEIKLVANGLLERHRQKILTSLEAATVLPAITYEDKTEAVDAEQTPIIDDEIPY